MGKVVILGAGVLGLYAAHELQERGHDVLILEKSDSLGGALRSYSIDGFDIEQFYHHFFTIDKDFVAALKKLGLGDKIFFRSVRNGFFYDGAIYPLLTPFDLLRFRPLSLRAKIGLGMFMIRAKLARDFEKLDRHTAKEWISAFGGGAAYNEFFRILLRSKFADDAERASAAWFVERIKLRSHTDSKGEILGYLRGGFSQLITTLKEKIIEKGGRIITGAQVKRMDSKNGKITSVHFNDTHANCEFVISSIPPFVLTKLVSLPKAYAQRLNQLEYQPAVCVLLGLKKPITKNYYWVTVLKDDNAFGAFVEHTNFLPKESYNGEHLAYLASYVNPKSKLMTLPEKDVFDFYFNDLQKMYPHLSKKDVLWWRIARDFNTGLIYKKGISSLIPDVQTPISNLFIGGMFNSYPERSVAKSIEIAATIIEKIDAQGRR